MMLVTVSIPSKVPLDLLSGIENFEINDVDTARWDTFAPFIGGEHKR